MNALRHLGRSIAALLVGGLCALIAFGLFLALAWLPRFSASTAYKTVALFLVIALSVILGGYVSGRLAGRSRLGHGLALGLILGLVAFGYVLGAGWLELLAVMITGLLGAAGGWLAERTRRRIPASGQS